MKFKFKPLRSRVLTVTLVAVLVVSVAVVAVAFVPMILKSAYAATIFSDGFEEGKCNPSPGVWNGNSTYAGGSIKVESSIVHTGSYAINVSVPGTAYAWAECHYNFFSTYSTMFMMAYVWFSALPASGVKVQIYPNIMDANAAHLIAGMCLYNNSGTVEWDLQYATNSATINDAYSTSPTPAVNRWDCIEVEAVCANGTGEVHGWINGTDIIDVTGLTNTNYLPQQVAVGLYSPTAIVQTDYVDDVIVATSYIPPITNQSATVTLNAPSNSYSTSSKTIKFNFTATLYHSGNFVSAQLWTNSSGTWSNKQSNTTDVLNATMNTISYTFSALGTYMWNVRVANSTSAFWASSNYTLIISLAWYSMSSASHPISGNPTDQHGFDVVHATNIVWCNVVVDGASRTYLAYDSDSEGNNIYLYYSNSINGTWTAYSGNPILSGTGLYRTPSVVLVNGTFYMFQNNINNKDVELWTSTNGITFTKAETVLTTSYDKWTDPSIWLNPNDNLWYLFWTQGYDSGGWWAIMARNSTTITGLATASDRVVMNVTYPYNTASPSVAYMNGCYWLLTEACTALNTSPWRVNAWYSKNVTSGYALAANSPILTDDEACPKLMVADDGVTCYLFTNQNSTANTWYQLRRTVYAVTPPSVVQTPYLLLTADPDQASYSRGESLTFTVDVLNQLCPPLASTLTLTVTGPSGYYYYDFQSVNVTAGSVAEYSFTWNTSNAAGTYVVEVSLVPAQLTAYDAIWLQVV